MKDRPAIAWAGKRWNAVYISVYIQAVCTRPSTATAPQAWGLKTACPRSAHTPGSRARAPASICSMAICAGAMRDSCWVVSVATAYRLAASSASTMPCHAPWAAPVAACSSRPLLSPTPTRASTSHGRRASGRGAPCSTAASSNSTNGWTW